MHTLNDSEILKLITPALPIEMQKQLKEIDEARSAIMEAKQTIKDCHYKLSKSMFIKTNGELTGSLNWKDVERLNRKRMKPIITE
tara:strand:- start:526 stop:780 length:255 start_codon:yes stop_codon:yes gene_type:complete